MVQQTRIELRREMHLQPAACIRDQRKGNRMAFRETILREGSDGVHHLVLHLPRNPLRRHPLVEFSHRILHPLIAALESHRPPQLIRLRPGEIRDRHRHPQHLLLENRHPQSPFQNPLKARMDIVHFLMPVAPVQIRMHQIPHDGPRADDRHLHRHIVKRLRPHDGQGRHLRPALHLESPYRIRPPHHFEHRRVIHRDFRKIHRLPAAGPDLQRVLHRRQHPQP